MMYRIYICAPLAGDIKANIDRVLMAITVLMKEWDEKLVTMPFLFIPHLAFRRLSFNDEGESDREWGMAMCLEAIYFCNEVIVLGPKDQWTEGMEQEIKIARKSATKKVTYREDL